MQQTTRINTPVLTEIAQPSSSLTVDDLQDVDHPVNTKALSGKRSGMAVSINDNIYVATGSNPSDEWKEVIMSSVPTPNALGLTIERLINSNSPLTAQNPTGLGGANARTVTFGTAVGTASDPVQLLSTGELKINIAGMYRLKLSLAYGRLGGAGESLVRFRVLVNGVQAGQSIGIKMNNSRVTQYFADEAWIELPSGVEIKYEVMRDSEGSDSGGLLQPPITAATAPTWNPCTCAALRVERWATL